MRLSFATLIPALLALPPLAAAEPRYLPAIRQELQKMGIAARCDATSPTRGQCRYTHQAAQATRFDMWLEYSDDTDTIYHYASRYLVVPRTSPRLGEVLQRLMSLNWSMLIGKLEWDAEDGEVRLSAVENTDSNFDRRAFRSTIRAFHNLAERYYRDLDALVRGAPAPAPTSPATAPPAKAAKAPAKAGPAR